MCNTNDLWKGFEFERVVCEISHFEIFIIFKKFQIFQIFKLSYLPNYNSYEKNKGIFGISIKLPFRKMVTWDQLGQSNFRFFRFLKSGPISLKFCGHVPNWNVSIPQKFHWNWSRTFDLMVIFIFFSLDIFERVWAFDWRSSCNATALKFWTFIDNVQY